MGSPPSASSRWRRHAARGAALAALATSSACGGEAALTAPAKAATARVEKGPAVFGLPRAWPRSRLVPDVDPGRHDEAEPADGSLRLWGRMRVRTRADGRIERAPDLLPVGRVSSIELPDRLGGGFVFVSATGRGTELWRAPSWLEPLVPLTSVGPAADMERPLVAGFDRLYLRLRSGELLALDPKSGAAIGFGPLPVAPAYADMVFADGWRAVVDTDLRGPLATFDAGQTWRPVPLSSRPRGIAVSEDSGTAQPPIVLGVDGGSYLLSATGDLAFFSSAAQPPRAPPRFAKPPGSRRTPQVLGPPEISPSTKPGPLGRRPLRMVLERGYPETATTALVAHEGRLVRVSLENGAVLEAHDDAYREPHATCSGIALAAREAASKNIGFVCGSPDGPTTIYEVAWPKLREVLRFDSPRVVLESGQGALVVRGTCSDDPAPADVRPFCIRSVDGATKEVRVRGEVGAERVIALHDGRVAIVVPPRPGTQGQLSLLQGSTSKHVPLRIPDGAPRELETGMWLDGMQQIAPDEIGGWIEAGGPTFGVRIKLDGAVEVGPVVNEPSGVLVSGRFGLALGSDGKLLETTDLGATWTEASLPAAPEDSGSVSFRRCGPAGCAIQGWLRVGWGEPASPDDLREVSQPEPPKLSTYKLSGAPLALSCKAGPTRGRTEKKAAVRAALGEASTGWLPFQSVPPPSLDKDEVGFDGGDAFGAAPFRAYVWGKRDSDWSRTGRFLVRFEDELSLDSVRSTAPSASPWPAEDYARDVFGAGSWGVNWNAFRDPSGRASLVSICRGRACTVLAVEDRQPVLPLTSAEPGGVVRPLPQSAVRVGPTWFYLGDEGIPDRLTLFRADLGRVRRITSFPRPLGRASATTPPRLVRRAKGGALGMVFLAKEGPFDRRGTRTVIEVDPETGALGEPQSLGRPDLGDLTVSAPCDPAQDGWLIELGSTDVSTDATLEGGRLGLDGLLLRARVSPGVACVEAASGVAALRAERPSKPGAKPGGTVESGPSGAFPLFVTDRSGGGRQELECRLTSGRGR